MPKGLRNLVLAAFVALLIVAAAVLLTPAVYALLIGWGWLEEGTFLKVLRRLILIPGLLALFAWLRPWRAGLAGSYGLLGPHAKPRGFLASYGVTVAVVCTLLVTHLLTGWLFWQEEIVASEVFGRLWEWAALGLLLGVMEEWFFRGWMDRRLLRRGLAPTATALLVAGVCAAAHAFKPSGLDMEVTHDAAGALEALLAWLANLVDPIRFGPTFLGLFLFSLLLTAAWRRTGTLWGPIGIHAAGVLVLRSYGGFTDRSPDGTWAGTKALVDGPPGWLLLGFAIYLVTRRRSEPAG